VVSKDGVAVVFVVIEETIVAVVVDALPLDEFLGKIFGIVFVVDPPEGFAARTTNFDEAEEIGVKLVEVIGKKVCCCGC